MNIVFVGSNGSRWMLHVSFAISDCGFFGAFSRDLSRSSWQMLRIPSLCAHCPSNESRLRCHYCFKTSICSHVDNRKHGGEGRIGNQEEEGSIDVHHACLVVGHLQVYQSQHNGHHLQRTSEEGWYQYNSAISQSWLIRLEMIQHHPT